MNPIQTHPKSAASSIELVRGTDWSAILVGAVIAAAILLGLMFFGSAVGMSAVSPWSSRTTAASVGVIAIAFLAIAHFLSGGIGGYIAARMRGGDVGQPTDERSYSDGLHGLGVWATTTVASAVLGAIVAIATASAALNAGGQVAAAAVPAVVQGIGQSVPTVEYWADQALRGNPEQLAGAQQGERNYGAEIGRIIGTGLAAGEIPPADRDYLARVVAGRTGLSPTDARQRVDTLIQQAQIATAKAAASAKEAANAARKATAAAAFWATLVLFLTAACAWFGAVMGGRHRDLRIYN